MRLWRAKTARVVKKKQVDGSGSPLQGQAGPGAQRAQQGVQQGGGTRHVLASHYGRKEVQSREAIIIYSLGVSPQAGQQRNSVGFRLSRGGQQRSPALEIPAQGRGAEVLLMPGS